MEYQNNLDYVATYRQGLREAFDQKKLPLDELNKVLGELDEQYQPIAERLDILKRCQKAVEQDLEDELAHHKRQK